jgi:hypothetical protein
MNSEVGPMSRNSDLMVKVYCRLLKVSMALQTESELSVLSKANILYLTGVTGNRRQHVALEFSEQPMEPMGTRYAWPSGQ